MLELGARAQEPRLFVGESLLQAPSFAIQISCFPFGSAPPRCGRTAGRSLLSCREAAKSALARTSRPASVMSYPLLLLCSFICGPRRVWPGPAHAPASFWKQLLHRCPGVLARANSCFRITGVISVPENSDLRLAKNAASKLFLLATPSGPESGPLSSWMSA